jgi:hypothetical protein
MILRRAGLISLCFKLLYALLKREESNGVNGHTKVCIVLLCNTLFVAERLFPPLGRLSTAWTQSSPGRTGRRAAWPSVICGWMRPPRAAVGGWDSGLGLFNRGIRIVIGSCDSFSLGAKRSQQASGAVTIDLHALEISVVGPNR